MLQNANFTVPQLGPLGRKWGHFEEKGARYSMVFIGSSRVVHHFIPEQFDAALHKAGYDTRSFNFGIGGMFPPESLYVLRKLMAQPSMRSRWVAIDLMDFRPIALGNEESERAVAWHDWRETRLTLRMLGGVKSDAALGAPEYHARLFVMRTLALGRGQGWLQRKAKVGDWKALPLTDSGYEAMETRKMSERENVEFNDSVAALKVMQQQVELPAPYRQELESLVALVRSHGAEPVFVVAPMIQGSLHFRDWPPAGVKQFSYDHPETYSALYRREDRNDPGHMDGNGAKEFTRIFAEEFSEWLKQQK